MKIDWKDVLDRSLAGFVSLALAIAFYFLILRAGELAKALGNVVKILRPFVIGSVMAYLLKTPCNLLEEQLKKYVPEKKKKGMGAISVFITLLVAIFLIYLLLSMVIPEVAVSVVTLAKAVPSNVDKFTAWTSEFLAGNEVIQNYVNTATEGIGDKLISWAQKDLLPMLQGMMGGFGTTVSSIVGAVGDMVIGVIVCIYILLDRKNLKRHALAVVYAIFKPEWADKVRREFVFIDKTFGGFFVGKVVDSAIIGLICYIFCLTMSLFTDFPNAMLVSVIIGVTNIIPYFGPFIGAIPSAILILMSSPMNCVIFIIFVLVLQQFDGNILGPRLLADSVGLTGFWVLFSITVFSGLFGFVGVLVGVPIFAVIYDLIKRIVIKGLQHHGKMEILQKTE